MNFLKESWAIPLFTTAIFFSFLMLTLLRKREAFLVNTFFKKPTKVIFIKKILFIFGLIFLCISLLDPRGPQEKIESEIPDQKTIIIIDSSASMLAEDVRPNRYKKSILMARHFIKKAFGHKIAVVLFSDIQKKLVPFTDDLDLLDARVAGLSDLGIYNGGSNISQAIKESLGYFKSSKKNNDAVGGNILVFTDSEGHDEDFDLTLPEKITLGIVGVGTSKGARIPNRDRNDVFRGYKKFESKEVISRLNEAWLKSLENKVEIYNYWVANSFTIPTEEILTFFNKHFSLKMNKGSAVVRPVKVDVFLVPAIIFFILSFLLYLPRGFTFACLCFFLFSPNENFAKEEESKNNELIDKLLLRMKEGELESKEKLKLAEVLLREKEVEAAEILYEEQLKQLSYKDRNNYAVTLLKNEKPITALKQFTEIQKQNHAGKIQLNDTEVGELRQNILLALAKKKEQENKKKEEEEKEKKKEEEKKGDDSQSGENQNQDGSPKKDQGGEDKKEGQSQKQRDEGKDKKDKNKGKKEKESQGKGEEQKGQKPESLKDKIDQIKKKRKMVKIPGLIKQIMSDDRSLQKKYLDTSTDKPKKLQKKDW